jgi:hypothetical protein
MFCASFSIDVLWPGFESFSCIVYPSGESGWSHEFMIAQVPGAYASGPGSFTKLTRCPDSLSCTTRSRIPAEGNGLDIPLQLANERSSEASSVAAEEDEMA